MNTQWKQRVVGIVVVIAVATIFMPILFHGTNPLKSTTVAVKEQTEAPVPNIVFNSPSMLTQQNTQLAANTNNNPASTAQAPNPVSNTQTPAAVNTASAPALTNAAIAVSQQPTQVAVARQMHQVNNAPNAAAPSTTAVVVNSAPTAPVHIVATAQTNATASMLANNTSQKKVVVGINNSAGANNLVPSKNAAMPTAWVLQVGTFGDSVNAQRLINKLRGFGYDAYSRQSTDGNKNLVRVFVGPEINKTELQNQRAKLQENLKINAVFKRYTL
jgi:DedD protein